MWLNDCSVLSQGVCNLPAREMGIAFARSVSEALRFKGLQGSRQIDHPGSDHTTATRPPRILVIFRVDSRRTVEPPGDVVIRGRNRHRYSHPLTEDNLPLVLVRQRIDCAS